MKILDFKNNRNYDNLIEAANVIKNGGLVIFPTETVYGIGANGLDEKAVKQIFLAKGRKQDNPLILHISNLDMLNQIAQNINDTEQKLIDAFFPGPFTIVLDSTSIVPSVVTGGLNTVGVRMPSGKIASKLIEYSGVPIAAPSANISGKPSGTNLDDIFDEFKNKVDYIIDGGLCEVGLESTVVRVIDNVPHILRPGKITPEQIKAVAGSVAIDSNILNKTSDVNKPLSPGMKYRHYSPKTNCVLVYSKNNAAMINKINELANDYNNFLVICCSENKNCYKNTISIGSKNDLNEVAKNIFSVLRKVDSYNADIVLIEGYEAKGLGLAIMNRLIRACDHNYIEI